MAHASDSIDWLRLAVWGGILAGTAGVFYGFYRAMTALWAVIQ